ncbi:arsenic resistance N-acetyltransferase ArsN2 [bacterium]|nr:arsenic resistance N-acetyltransferase ArsN2 [bacterium]
MNSKLSVRFAKPEDFEDIRNLLKSTQLPFEDVETGNGHFLLAKREDQLVGCVGLQIYGDDGLLRSLVVNENERSQGLGKVLTQEILEYALRLNLRKIYLLTTTADGFFAKRGFVRTDRTSVPDTIRSTKEFSSLCPSTAVFMSKELTRQAT